MSNSSATTAWIDTHTHLDYEYPGQSEGYLERARNAGVMGFVSIGADLNHWDQIKIIAERNLDVAFTVGIHPNDAQLFDETVAKKIESYLEHPKCVALGEIGLDYHYKEPLPKVQHEAFEQQFAIAKKHQKPIVVHSRQGEEDLLQLLKNGLRSSDVGANGPGVIHCFSGTLPFAKACLDLGFYISFSGILTFKNAQEVREVAQYAPLDRILVETDAPYLAPMPHRGKPNESMFLPYTGQRLAELRGLTTAEMAKITTQNAKACFRWELN